MAPFFVLISTFLVTRILGALGVTRFKAPRSSFRYATAALFLVTAASRFSPLRNDLVKMVPKGVPNPELAVNLAGVLEALGAVGLFVPKTRKLAARCLAAMLVVLLPANIKAARQDIDLGGKKAVSIPLRIPIQIVFIIFSLASASNDKESR